MASPYVYTPESSYQPGPYAVPNAAPGSPYSPFIPDVSLYPPSPYSRPGSVHGSPASGVVNLPPVGGVPFPAAPPSPVLGGFIPPTFEETFWGPRQRRPSWHGAPTGGLTVPQGHVRSNSFGQANAPPFYPPPATAPVYANGYDAWLQWQQQQHQQQQQQQLEAQKKQIYIHPLLNGENPARQFFFNLANPHFQPVKIVGPNQWVPLGSEELAQPATHPPVYELKIVCDATPQWPIHIRYEPPSNPYYSPHPSAALQPGHGAPPITVGDVLTQLHKHLHAMVAQHEWNQMSTKEEKEITKAFQRRCKMMGKGEYMVWRQKGLRRVDYLKDRCVFSGVLRTGSGLGEVKLVTQPMPKTN
ncbi:hypothetical protein CC1G_09795 [Coprinopsis cinerea okayama7|uniref:DUF6699 domain-containing protein n=1 Tax=Coprinopsis cinerea (strain Okayama-7 / 130 / ATCC MYA-4618 / FGSC 9003) TaxID=240176 RepID=A8NM93_COPC7|nr:hypothetical protein CC1G_09795 [Coprinopsis cinerea okayama7\|eukprot:XP_001834868.1 hypothetical protein CC1G_09795 [Coprinopsis cinerea okayama7\